MKKADERLVHLITDSIKMATERFESNQLAVCFQSLLIDELDGLDGFLNFCGIIRDCIILGFGWWRLHGNLASDFVYMAELDDSRTLC